MTASRPQHVVLVHRYFWPDTPPYASMLRSIAIRLTEEGHRVTVLSCRPSYRPGERAPAARRDRSEGYDVVRWPVLADRRSAALKLVNMALYALRLLAARRHWRNADVVVAATTPPIMVALACSVVARLGGARFVYHRQDIYPEVLGAGRGPLRRLLLAGLRRVDAGTDRRAWRCVALSQDMAETIAVRTSGRARTVVLNNFDPWPTRAPDPSEAAGRGATPVTAQRHAPGRLDIVFAGRLGRFQGMEYLLELVEQTAGEARIAWHVYGDGPMRGRFDAAAAAGARVTTYGYQPPGRVAAFVRERAHLGVVSLSPGVVRAAYPSKTLTYLRHGCPILAIVERDCELAAMITAERLGLVGAHDEVPELARRLRAAAAHPEELAAARRNSVRVYRDRFCAERQLGRWVDLVQEVEPR